MQNKQLFKQLASLLNAESECPNYMDWSVLMPIAVEHGISIGPSEMDLSAWSANDWKEKMLDTSFGNDKIPQLAIVKCLIAKLESENDNPKN